MTRCSVIFHFLRCFLSGGDRWSENIECFEVIADNEPGPWAHVTWDVFWSLGVVS
jgi:hypothetical protein